MTITHIFTLTTVVTNLVPWLL